MSYFGMHNHTMYSNITTGLDSLNTLEQLISTAKQKNLKGIAITDHDNLSQINKVNNLQKELRKKDEDFTLAFGNEIYLIDDFNVDAEDFQKTRRRYYHFILVAKNETGFRMLKDLSSRAWYRSATQRGRRRVPTLKSDIEEVIKYYGKGHLSATTACLGGELATAVLDDRPEDADKFVYWCQEQFGEDDFFIEVQPSDSKEQIKFNKTVKNRYWNDFNFVITSDVHYLVKEDLPLFEAFLRSTNEWREVQEYYGFTYVMSAEEMIEIMKLSDYSEEEMRTMFDNTLKVMEQVEFFDINRKPTIPQIELEEITEKLYNDDYSKYEYLNWAVNDKDNQTNYCVKTCLNELVKRDLWNDEYLARLNEEFDVFKYQTDELGSNFFAYFNTISYYIDLSWEVGCAVGPSRGSSSGSLLAWLMDIVQMDPIKAELPFFRFAHKFRTSILDIDTDFDPVKRPALIEKIREERGELGLLKVATFKTLSLKAAIGNAGRGYRDKEYPKGLDPDVIGYLSSLIEIRRGFVATLKQTLKGDEVTGFKVNHTFIKEVENYPGLLTLIERMEGTIVNSSTHAAAIVLFDNENRIQDDHYLDHCSVMRAPNGDLCTCVDLHDVEDLGAIKYDFLLLSTLSIQTATFDLLRKDGVIPKELTLKECYRNYINPNTINFDNPLIWEKLHNFEVLSVFQWSEASGIKGINEMKPQTLDELSAANGLIRLMSDGDEETMIERFVRIKNNPDEFELEMQNNGLTKEIRDIMHEELDRTNGVAAYQENFMRLTQSLAGYTLGEADRLRKTVAKKKMSEIEQAEKTFSDKLVAKHPELTEHSRKYLYKIIIAPSLGYAFSLNHSLPYSVIGVQCVLMGGILFNPIYWQTACLLQRSGALNGKSPKYNKLAKAIGHITEHGTNIKTLNINKSEINFSHDIKANTIYFGIGAAKGIRKTAVEHLIENRPFSSFQDYMERGAKDITSTVALVKSGAFDEFGDRLEIIEQLADLKADMKKKLNGQNLLMISRKGYWPETTEELIESKRIFNFTQYLKQLKYKLNDKAKDFLDEVGCPYEYLEFNKDIWKKSYYDPAMIPIKNYLKENQEELLERVNNDIVQEWRDKYFPENNLAKWEIEVLGLCFQEHPLKDVQNIVNFFELPEEPVVKNLITTNQGRTFPLYDLVIIAGIAVAKDKLHSSFTLLTENGIVDVKMRKEMFSHYDKQISQILPDGKKKVLEKSWFNRGIPLLIHGMRRGEFFIPKKYKNSPMKHTIYKITDVDDNGKVKVQTDRKKGIAEDDRSEE